MIKKEVKIHTEYIRLCDLLKFASVVNSGSDAKFLILDGKAKVNGEVALERTRKIYPGMVVTCKYDDEYEIMVR